MSYLTNRRTRRVFKLDKGLSEMQVQELQEIEDASEYWLNEMNLLDEEIRALKESIEGQEADLEYRKQNRLPILQLEQNIRRGKDKLLHLREDYRHADEMFQRLG